MKIQLAQAELLWLNNIITPYLALAMKHREQDGGKLMRLVGKMRYKFTPNAAYVSLNKRERELLRDLIDYRLGQLGARDAMTEEVPFLQTLKTKVQA